MDRKGLMDGLLPTVDAVTTLNVRRPPNHGQSDAVDGMAYLGSTGSMCRG